MGLDLQQLSGMRGGSSVHAVHAELMLVFSILEGVDTQQRAAQKAADGAAFANFSGSDDEFASRPSNNHFRKLAEEAYEVEMNKCCQCLNDRDEMLGLAEEWYLENRYHPLYCPECSEPFCASCYTYASDWYLWYHHKQRREREEPVSFSLTSQMNNDQYKYLWLEPCNRLKIRLSAESLRDKVASSLQASICC